mgnify:CR=1 FL=1
MLPGVDLGGRRSRIKRRSARYSLAYAVDASMVATLPLGRVVSSALSQRLRSWSIIDGRRGLGRTGARLRAVWLDDARLAPRNRDIYYKGVVGLLNRRMAKR